MWQFSRENRGASGFASCLSDASLNHTVVFKRLQAANDTASSFEFRYSHRSIDSSKSILQEPPSAAHEYNPACGITMAQLSQGF